jgi:hypothetical protein
MCGAGMPCQCNRANEPDINQIVDEEEDLPARSVTACATDESGPITSFSSPRPALALLLTPERLVPISPSSKGAFGPFCPMGVPGYCRSRNGSWGHIRFAQP